MLFRILIQWWRNRGKAASASGAASPGGAPGEPPRETSVQVGARAMELELSNVVAVARREYMARARTRTFRVTTVILVIAALALALAPVLIRWADQGSGPTRVEVAVGDSAPAVDAATTVAAVLNAAASGGSATATAPTYEVTSTSDVAGARARVDSGDSAGLLVITRDPASAILHFTFVTKASAVDRISQFMSAAAALVSREDLLARAGVPADVQAKLQAPPFYDSQTPSGKPISDTAEKMINQFAIGFVLSIVLFMAIILYGQWVAYSVAEEKSSRVMEVILGAASPFELLAGKVVGVGGLALTQYAIIFVPALVVLLLQDQISGFVLGQSVSAASLPPGLSIELLITFGVLFVLGFGLYAVLYAGAAALVSRTEDINAIVAPMTMISVAGYLVAVYSSTGLIAPDSLLVRVMSFIPFFSPYLILSRMGSGSMSPFEIVVAVALLAVAVPVALWFAARLYAAGVLMYGQRPSMKLMWRVLRGS